MNVYKKNYKRVLTRNRSVKISIIMIDIIKEVVSHVDNLRLLFKLTNYVKKNTLNLLKLIKIELFITGGLFG